MAMIQVRAEWYHGGTAFRPDTNRFSLKFSFEDRSGLDTATVVVGSAEGTVIGHLGEVIASSTIGESVRVESWIHPPLSPFDFVRDPHPPKPGATEATRGLLAKRFKGAKRLSHKD